MQALGTQILVELYDCDPKKLNDRNHIEYTLSEAVKQSGATIVTTAFHTFSPFGVSGVIVIAESHVSIHTWPEHRYAAVDIFTCGDKIDPWVIHNEIKNALGAVNTSVTELKRGIFDTKEKLKHKIA